MISVPYEVKKALRDGMLRKNYRFVVLNDDGTEDFTIDNDTLVSESVNIDERMCSGDTLKFGLCEGSSLEFQYFDYPNITGKRVQAFVDVQCFDDNDTSYHTIGELVANGAAFTVTEACNYQFTIPANVSGVIFRYDANGIKTAEQSRPARQEPWLIVLSANVGDYFLLTSTYSYSAPIGIEASHYRYTIPMGFFDVKKCSRQASTGIIKATAYNKLMSEYLDAKVNDELIQQFGDSNPYVMDVLRVMLDGYGIRVMNTERIPLEYYQQGTGTSSSAFRYTNLLGDQGIFSPPMNITTSTNCYFAWRMLVYECTTTVNDFLRFIEEFDLDAYSDSLEAYLKTEISKMQTNKTADQLWDLGNFNRGFDIGLHCSAYPNYRYYGKLGYEAGLSNFYGTFKDLANATQTGVLAVDFIFNDIVAIADNNYNVTNSIALLSSGGTYKYLDQNSQQKTATYTPPLFPNGDVPSGALFSSMEVYRILDLAEIEKQRIDVETIPDITLRDLQSATFETVCQFGQLDRETDLFSGVELNYSGLYPADTLYPATDLYPGGAALSGTKSMYSKLWADEGNVHKWRYLIITYKGLNEDQQEEECTLQRTVNEDGTDDYNMSDNWLFRNLIWTAVQVGEYADAMVAKMQDVTWFPFEMWCAGLPYLETGDEIEIPLNGESYTSYVLQRQLKGIQNLQDTYINGTLDIF